MTHSRNWLLALMASAALASAVTIPETAAAQSAVPGAPSGLAPATPQDPPALGPCPTAAELEAYRQAVFNNRQALKAHKARLDAARQAIEANQRALRATGQAQAANGFNASLQQINNASQATDGMIRHQDDLFDIYWQKLQESNNGRTTICYGPTVRPPSGVMIRSQAPIETPRPATSVAMAVPAGGLTGALAAGRQSFVTPGAPAYRPALSAPAAGLR